MSEDDLALVYPRLEQLYPKDPTARAEVDIILVPGLGGHYVKTWEADDKTLWPRDLLARNMQDIRVLSFQYNTTLMGTTSEAGIRDHAGDLLDKIFNDREDDESATLRPIIFVGHSLGGILIKRALKAAHDERKYRFLWEASRGIMFFATPHWGIDRSSWRDFLRHVLQYDAPVKDAEPTRKMLRDIDQNSTAILKISGDFKPLHEDLAFVTFIEDMPMKGLKYVLLDEGRGAMRAPTERIQSLSGDHVEICKFGKDEDSIDAFQTVQDDIEWLIGQEPKAIANDSEEVDRIGPEGKRALYSLCSDQFHCYFLDKTATPGTCSWIKERQQFKDWLDNKPGKRKLWIQGRPACGKSFLARHIITDIIPSKSQHAVAHCFLSDSLPARGDLQALLRATLHQALRLVPDLTTKFLLPKFQEAQGREAGEQEIWTEDTLRAIWPDAMAEVTAREIVVVVIDGFDELRRPCQEAFLDCLQKFEKKLPHPKMFRLLVLSREDRGVESLPTRLLEGFEKYTVKPEDTRKDILRTVKEGMGYIWNRVVGTTAYLDREETCETIVERSKGMYLWATLIVEELNRTRIINEIQIRDIIESAPQDITGLYGHILERMCENYTRRSFIKQVLLWAVFQRERLKAAGFNIGKALGMVMEQYSRQKITSQEVEEFLDGNVEIKVDLYCGQLVQFRDGRLELVHRSFKEYLLTDLPKKASKPFHTGLYLGRERSHAALANICIAYLTLPYFEDSGTEPEAGRMGLWESKVRKRIRKHPFVRYASLYWHKHLKAAGPIEPDANNPEVELGRRLLEDISTEYAKCWTEVWWFCTRGPTQDYPRGRLAMEIISMSKPPIAFKEEAPTAPPSETKLSTRTEKPPSLSGDKSSVVEDSPAESETANAPVASFIPEAPLEFTPKDKADRVDPVKHEPPNRPKRQEQFPESPNPAPISPAQSRRDPSLNEAPRKKPQQDMLPNNNKPPRDKESKAEPPKVRPPQETPPEAGKVRRAGWWTRVKRAGTSLMNEALDFEA